MKALIFLTCLVAIACCLDARDLEDVTTQQDDPVNVEEDPVRTRFKCDSPLLNPNLNRLAPLNGVLISGMTGGEDDAVMSELRDDLVEVCAPLQGKEVCCTSAGFTELKDINFKNIKKTFTDFVTKRRERIKFMTEEFKTEKTFEEVNKLLAQNEAVYENEFVKAYTEEKVGEYLVAEKAKPGNDGKKPDGSGGYVDKTRADFPGFKGDPAKFKKIDDKSGKMDCGELTKPECKAKMQKDQLAREERKAADQGQKKKDKKNSWECKGNEQQKADCDKRKQEQAAAVEEATRLLANVEDSLTFLRTLVQKEGDQDAAKAAGDKTDKAGQVAEQQKWKKDMTEEEKTKWAEYKKEKKASMKTDYTKSVEEKTEKRTKRTANVTRQMKDNRRDFIKAQSKCFRRLFKVTIGMGCAACQADQSAFLVVTRDAANPEKNSFQITMAKSVCTNLQKDCFDYLRLSNLQGRNVLDLKKMKKLQSKKATLTVQRQAIKDAMTEEVAADAAAAVVAAHDEKVQAAIKLYEDEWKSATELDGANDFVGVAKDDASYGFKMPVECVSETECTWICENMVDANGVTDAAIDSEQVTDMDDIAESNGSFETNLVDDGDDTTEDQSGDNENDANQVSERVLVLDGASSVVYASDTTTGYVADNDEFEAGVEVEDPLMSEAIYDDDNTPDPEPTPTPDVKAANAYTVGFSMLLVALVQYMA